MCVCVCVCHLQVEAHKAQLAEKDAAITDLQEQVRGTHALRSRAVYSLYVVVALRAGFS